MKERRNTYIFLICLLSILGFETYASNSGFDLKSNPELLLQSNQDSTIFKIFQTADSLFNKKVYTIALEKSYEVLDHPKATENRLLVADTYNLIGQIWDKINSKNSSHKSIANFKRSLEVLTEILRSESSQENFVEKNSISAVPEYKYLLGYNKIAQGYHKLYRQLLGRRQNKSDEFRTMDSLSLIKYKDSSFYYYNKILESNSLSTDILKLKSRIYGNISGIYLYEKMYDEAENYAIKSLELKEKFGDKYSLAFGYNALANIYFFKGQYEESKNTIFRAIEEIEKMKGERIDRLNSQLYQNAAYSMYHLKDYEAYSYLKKSWNLRVVLERSEREKELAAIEAERNYDKGIQEGIFQEEIKRREARTVTWIIGISSFSIILILVFLLNQYKLRQKNLGLELSKQELMQQQKLEKLKNESQIRILNATLDGKESERKQIAETLHDSVSALLSSANLHLQACKTQFNGSTPIEVDKSQTIINEASQKIRDLSHTLVSSILLKFGLSYAIKDISEKFSNSELKIDFETKYIKRYDQGFEIKLYNIIQEFINNILKHSKASEAKITLVEKRKRLYLTIEDNGLGFDKTKITEKDGLGINQIDARIQMMQGKFHIESGKGKGTVITIELPVFEKRLEAIS